MNEPIKCKKCEKFFDSDFNVCPYCGNVVENQETKETVIEETNAETPKEKYCVKCGAQMPASTNFCTNCGNKFDAQVNISPTYTQQTVTPVSAGGQVVYPMKWFKFLIYFLLFFGALYNFANGINYISGEIYSVQSGSEITAEMVYSVYGSGLKTFDVIYGFLMLGIAAFGIYTRFRLAKYKTNGPLLLYGLYGIGAVLSIFYNFCLFAITGLNQIFDVSSITSVLVSALFIFLNYKYFSKRKNLFINQ